MFNSKLVPSVTFGSVCVYVCVWERESEIQREKSTEFYILKLIFGIVLHYSFFPNFDPSIDYLINYFKAFKHMIFRKSLQSVWCSRISAYVSYAYFQILFMCAWVNDCFRMCAWAWMSVRKFVIVRGETNIFNYEILTDDLFAMKSALPCSLHKCTRLIHSLRSLKWIDNVNAERMLLFVCNFP